MHLGLTALMRPFPSSTKLSNAYASTRRIVLTRNRKALALSFGSRVCHPRCLAWPPRPTQILSAWAALSTLLPAAAIARLERLWEDDGHGDYRVADEEERRDADADGAARPRGLASLLAMLASGVDVRTGWAAAQVRQLAETSEFCVVASEDRSQPPVYADAIIVAVPVTVLQRRHLRFDPPLPPSQLAAIDSIAVQPACKVCLTFDRPPWPPSGPMAAEFAKHPVHSVLCEGMAIPELWFRDMRTTYNPVGEGSRGDLARRAECARCAGQANAWSACGFATGDYAAALMARAGSVASASTPGTRTTAVTDAAAEILPVPAGHRSLPCGPFCAPSSGG